MPQNRSATAQVPNPAPLKAPIQKALASLSVNLDDELMRYRQARQGDGATLPAKTKLAFRKRRKQVDLITMTRASARNSVAADASVLENAIPPAPANSATPVPPPMSPPPPPPGPTRVGYPQPAVMPPARSSTLTARGGPLAAYTAMPDDYLASTEVLLSSGAFPETVTNDYSDYDDTDYSPSLRDQLMTPLGIGSLLLLLVGSATFGYLVTSPEAISHLAQLPLVRGLTGSSSTPVDPTAANPNPVNPDVNSSVAGLQGIGPDLSEDEFKHLDLSQISTLPSDPTPSATTDPNSPVAPNSTMTVPGQELDPNQASHRSPLDRAETASTIALPSPTTAPRPAAPTTTNSTPRPTTTVPSQVVATAPRPAAQTPPQPITASGAAPTPRPPQPLQPMAAATPSRPPQPLQPETPSTTQSPPAPITQPPPSVAAARPNYYVVTDYTGDQSLSTARTAVNDAYVRNFPNGAKIQMGAFSQAGSAQSLVQQLQGQGIPAQVYTAP